MGCAEAPAEQWFLNIAAPQCCLSGTIPPQVEAVPAFRFILPCSPIRAKEVPAGDGWLHEVKFDGYRVQAHKIGSRVVIYSRNGHDFTERFPSIAQLLQELPAKAAVLDGEVVASDGLVLLRVAEERGLEGVVSKRRDAPHRSGECRDWRKVKTLAWRDVGKGRVLRSTAPRPERRPLLLAEVSG